MFRPVSKKTTLHYHDELDDKQPSSAPRSRNIPRTAAAAAANPAAAAVQEYSPLLRHSPDRQDDTNSEFWGEGMKRCDSNSIHESRQTRMKLVKLLQRLNKDQVTIELKNGTVIRGIVVEVDATMNCHLDALLVETDVRENANQKAAAAGVTPASASGMASG
eukprot:scaffold130379_cov88-Attheya_sp.AAC.1